MLCPKCGAQLSDSAVICRACGAMLPEQPAAPKTPYPPTSQPAENTASAQPNAPRTCARVRCPARGRRALLHQLRRARAGTARFL